MSQRIPSDIFNLDIVVQRGTESTSAVGKLSLSFTSPVVTFSGLARIDKYRYGGGLGAWAEQGFVDTPTHKLFCEWDVDVCSGDRIVEVVDATVYDVIEAWIPGGFKHHKEAWLKKR